MIFGGGYGDSFGCYRTFEEGFYSYRRALRHLLGLYGRFGTFCGRLGRLKEALGTFGTFLTIRGNLGDDWGS